MFRKIEPEMIFVSILLLVLVIFAWLCITDVRHQVYFKEISVKDYQEIREFDKDIYLPYLNDSVIQQWEYREIKRRHQERQIQQLKGSMK